MPIKKSAEIQLLGARIRQLRKKLRLTQEQLAERSGMHYKFLGGIERGSENPTIQILGRLAEALHVTLAELFQYESLGIDPEHARKRLAQAINQSSNEELLRLYRVYRSL